MLAGGAPPPLEAGGAAARAEEAAAQAALEHVAPGEEASGALCLLAPLLPRVVQLCHHPHVLVPGVCLGPWRGVSGALERWSGEEQTLQTLLCQHAAPIAERLRGEAGALSDAAAVRADALGALRAVLPMIAEEAVGAIVARA